MTGEAFNSMLDPAGWPPALPPPAQCHAKAKSTGQRCKLRHIPFATTCRRHGSLGGQHGRQHALDLHNTRRTEALVTAWATQTMLELGYPASLIATLTGPGSDETARELTTAAAARPPLRDGELTSIALSTLASRAGQAAAEWTQQHPACGRPAC